jgi:hypothetical protein
LQRRVVFRVIPETNDSKSRGSVDHFSPTKTATTLWRLPMKLTTDSDDGYGQAANGITVRFTVTVKKQLIESHELFSEEERNACWCTHDEKEKFTTKREKVVVRMEAGKPEKRSRPYRGLDCWTEKGSKVFNAQVAKTIDAVMDEQDAQWNACVDNYKRLAAMSQAVTAVSAEKALHIAYQDEQEAIAIRGTMFDDVNCTTDDDSTPVGMASLVAKRRRERNRNKKSKNGTTATQKRTRRRRARKENRQDPPGEKASEVAKQKQVRARKVKSLKSSETGKVKLRPKRSVK